MTRIDANEQPASNKEISKERDDVPARSDYRLEALSRILSSGHFRASERNKQFLKFVVEETIAGRANRIKAFTVAVDVFGRDSSFDASVDPIVRIAAGHLRRSLDDYYSGYGKHDPVRIVLPLGTYAPIFAKQERLPGRTIMRIRQLIADRQRRLQSGAVSVTMALAGAVLGSVYYFASYEDTTEKTPVIVVARVQPYPPEKVAETIADLFNQSLWGALGESHQFRVVGVKSDETLNDVLRRTQAMFGNSMPLYQLLSTLRRDGDELRVYWHVLDGRSNESYLSASTVREVGDPIGASLPNELAQEVATSVRKFSQEGSVAGEH
jgi:TolB-like protein